MLPFGIPKTERVLQVADLSVSFRQEGQWRSVVRALNFEIVANETLAIVGESGSGKSVTALSVLGLLPPGTTKVEGGIHFRGKNLLDMSPAQLRAVRGNDIAMIFQEPMTSLNPVMRVGDQIAETLMAHSGSGQAQAKAEAQRLMEKVRIPGATRRFSAYPYQFSGGMRQRIMIAIALACKPQLLIADEPTTALDVTVQAQILSLIKELQTENNMAALFITHDMGVVADVADRVLVMRRGEQIETGSTADIFSHPTQTYTRALLSAVPHLGTITSSRPQPLPTFDAETGTMEAAADYPATVDLSSEKLLNVENLSARFDIGRTIFGRVTARIHAVENVSFDLAKGETLAIVGESGSGKSTTGKLIAGLLKPTSGQVAIAGSRVDTCSRLDLSRKVQMIFQDPFASLNPRLSTGSAIAEPIRIHRLMSSSQARDRVANLLTTVGLSPDMASRYPHQFSGGQRQRICIARALALQPSVIVADEAVSALDATIKAQIVNLLLELQQGLKIGMIFISHDMAVVERISHRVAVMYHGEIVEIGPRAAIFANPSHPYTRRLIEAVPVVDPARRIRRPASAEFELPSGIVVGEGERPKRDYFEVSPGHIAQVPGPEWADYLI